jgi:hypothetical protein
LDLHGTIQSTQLILSVTKRRAAESHDDESHNEGAPYIFKKVDFRDMPYKREGREYVQGLTFDQHVMVTLVTFQLKKDYQGLTLSSYLFSLVVDEATRDIEDDNMRCMLFVMMWY